ASVVKFFQAASDTSSAPRSRSTNARTFPEKTGESTGNRPRLSIARRCLAASNAFLPLSVHSRRRSSNRSHERSRGRITPSNHAAARGWTGDRRLAGEALQDLLGEFPLHRLEALPRIVGRPIPEHPRDAAETRKEPHQLTSSRPGDHRNTMRTLC